MCVVVKIVLRAGPLLQVSTVSGEVEEIGWVSRAWRTNVAQGIEAYFFCGNPQGPRAGCYLYNTCDHVCELVWDEGGDE